MAAPGPGCGGRHSAGLRDERESFGEGNTDQAASGQSVRRVVCQHDQILVVADDQCFGRLHQRRPRESLLGDELLAASVPDMLAPSGKIVARRGLLLARPLPARERIQARVADHFQCRLGFLQTCLKFFDLP
jgi:hypothetical protein